LLDLVRTCRDRLELRDRDITVLRGLLSLLPADPDPATQLVVFASNRVLIERCDGIDERTLRRRISQLQRSGLLARKSSPNGKRFQVRDEDAAGRLTYGIDLAPLFQVADHLAALAEDCRKEALRKSALRSMIRQALFEFPEAGTPELREEARLTLRRDADCDQLQNLLTELELSRPEKATPPPGWTDERTIQMTANNGQNDRHIQSSNKETYESECSRDAIDDNTDTARDNDLTVAECLDLAPTVRAMAPATPQSWEDVIDLSSILAPAIGLSPKSIQSAEEQLGRHGCALAVLGLVEAFGRIRNPQAYLSALTNRAQKHGIDFIRMFRSLAKPAVAQMRCG
jgi:replication initiation protein RepC